MERRSLRLRAPDAAREGLEELEARLAEDHSPLLLERYGSCRASSSGTGYDYRARAASTLSGLGFAGGLEAPWPGSFSGGEQSRIASPGSCSSRPRPARRADEPPRPRGHRVARELRQGAKSAVLVVSHDRYFLDAVAGSILELEGGKLTRYPGNYSAYVRRKGQRAARAQGQGERRAQGAARALYREEPGEGEEGQPGQEQAEAPRPDGEDRGPEQRRQNMKLDLGDTSRAGA